MELGLQDGILIIVSILATSACFNIALYFGYHKKTPYLFFAFYCVFHCFKILLKTYPEDQVLVPMLGLTSYELVYLSVILGMTSLIIFLSHYLKIPHKRWLNLSFVFLSVLFFFFIHELDYIKGSIFLAIIIASYGTRKNRNAIWILLGLLGFASCVGLGFAQLLEYGYFIGVIVLIICMALASSIELSKQNAQYQQAILRSTRLENQLLKTTIQPHFILNSLTSLQELIEQDPQLALSFVQDLSNEFELFSRISDRKFISMKDELGLVNSYISIMGVRKGAKFRLKTENLTDHDVIPPGVFLTLIENGITHGYESKDEGLFSISKEADGEHTIFSIFNDGDVNLPVDKIGMGLNYVKVRLKESYGDKFKFESHPFEGGWLSRIQVWA